MMEIEIATYGNSDQLLLNLILGVMIFGLSLDLKPKDFLLVFRQPKAPIAGLIAQFLLLPAATFLLTLMLDLHPAIELSMILVSCCPGGAISNFITLLAKGNVALSLSMTAMSSLVAIVLLPLNFGLWSSLNPETASLLNEIQVDSGAIFQMLIFVLAIPLAFGQLVRQKLPIIAEHMHRIIKPLSVIILIGFIVAAVTKNSEMFFTSFWTFFVIVAAHNALAFLLGYGSARFNNLNGPDTRAITIEVGIQNSSLAIAIIFSQFAANSHMLLIASFWGTWHIVAGFGVALIGQRFAAQEAQKGIRDAD